MFLDTSFCVDLLRERTRRQEGAATRRLRELQEVPLHLSLFALCELRAGAHHAASPLRELKKLELLTNALQVVFPDLSFASVYGETEAHLRRSGHPIPTMDLLIGVMAKVHGMALLTRDTTHFVRIPGLVVEGY